MLGNDSMMTIDARSPSDHPLKPRMNSLLPPINGLSQNISTESTKFAPDANMSRKLLNLSVT